MQLTPRRLRGERVCGVQLLQALQRGGLGRRAGRPEAGQARRARATALLIGSRAGLACCAHHTGALATAHDVARVVLAAHLSLHV